MSIRPLALTVALCAAALAAPALAQDGPAPAAPPAAAGGEKVKVAVVLQKGQSWALESVTTNKTGVKMGEMEFENDLGKTKMQLVTVESVDEKGAATVREKTTRVHGKFANPMAGEFPFDSAGAACDPTGIPQIDQLIEMSVAEAGQEQTVTVLPSGKRQGAEGGEGQGMTSVVLPDRPLAVGESWTDENEIQQMGMTLRTKIKNTVKAIDADIVTVSHAGTLEMAPPAEGEEAQATVSDGKISGETRLLRKDGMLKSSDSDVSMKITIPSQSLDLDIKTNTHVERKPADAATPPAPPKKPDPAPAPAPVPTLTPEKGPEAPPVK